MKFWSSLSNSSMFTECSVAGSVMFTANDVMSAITTCRYWTSDFHASCLYIGDVRILASANFSSSDNPRPQNDISCLVRALSASKVSLYTSPAWWGFANSSDKQRLEAFLRRCIRLHLYQQCDPTVTQLVEDMEDNRFTDVFNNEQHVLFHHHSHMYNLRPRRHELTLAIKGDARNFFERQLFKDTY